MAPSHSSRQALFTERLPPFLYFEDATAFSHLNGMVRITLEAARIVPTGGGNATFDRVIVAHLRMNVPAARALKAAIEGALLLAAPAPQTKN
jgi:hypothetical protein